MLQALEGRLADLAEREGRALQRVRGDIEVALQDAEMGLQVQMLEVPFGKVFPLLWIKY